ncbi:MAG: hypothetical protein RIG82_03390 [Phycisphaeraceae bacterium]
MIVFAQCHDGILHYDPAGNLLSRFGGDRWLSAHGLTYQTDGDTEFLWLTDEKSGYVAKTNLTGDVIQALPTPDIRKVSSGLSDNGTNSHSYKPTWAAEDTTRGLIWVADGYGSSLIYQYDHQGKLVKAITGIDSGTRLACPHGITLDESGNLWIADRGNRRIVIYNPEGHYTEAFQDLCHSPCGFDYTESLIVIPELYGSIKLLDRSWRLVAELGRNASIHIERLPDGEISRTMPEHWPNVDRATIPSRSFNSPHASCFGREGEIYVVEWILGGRISRIDLL